jgi:hypothetical protein
MLFLGKRFDHLFIPFSGSLIQEPAKLATQRATWRAYCPFFSCCAMNVRAEEI